MSALREAEGWLSTMDIAERTKAPWRPVAAALTRLSKAGAVDCTVVDVPGTARSKEQRRMFRLSLVTGGRIVRQG